MALLRLSGAEIGPAFQPARSPFSCPSLPWPCHTADDLDALDLVVTVLRLDVDPEEFASFVEEVEPRLRRALTALRGYETGRDATAEALAWAWANWPQLRAMENPIGYLYRVGVSRTRPRRVRTLYAAPPVDLQDIEPRLLPALLKLPEKQRIAVLLVYGLGWTHQEVAEAMGVSRSTVGTHAARAMVRLRKELGARDD